METNLTFNLVNPGEFQVRRDQYVVGKVETIGDQARVSGFSRLSMGLCGCGRYISAITGGGCDVVIDFDPKSQCQEAVSQHKYQAAEKGLILNLALDLFRCSSTPNYEMRLDIGHKKESRFGSKKRTQVEVYQDDRIVGDFWSIDPTGCVTPYPHHTGMANSVQICGLQRVSDPVWMPSAPPFLNYVLGVRVGKKLPPKDQVGFSSEFTLEARDLEILLQRLNAVSAGVGQALQQWDPEQDYTRAVASLVAGLEHKIKLDTAVKH